MRTPSVRDLPAPLARAARHLAERLRAGGFRGWLVGGAVRDLALGRVPAEIDMASAATPDEVAALFPRTVPVGLSFGTLLVQADGAGVEHTTFRTEGVYHDARHPDEVRFGTSVEEDAARRDFTCNALFLDPLSDELRDPTGGLADLRAGRLACVGEPAERFGEDALRLLRLARFAGTLELAVDEAHMAAARAAAPRLARVAVERVLRELESSCAKGGMARALSVMAAAGLLEPVFPGGAWSAGLPARLRAVEALGERPALAEVLAVLLGDAPGERSLERAGAGRGAAAGTPAGAAADVERLRPSRELLQRFRDVAALAREAEALRAEGGRLPADGAARSRTLRLLRHDAAEGALRVAAARRRAVGEPAADLEDLAALRRKLGDDVLRPPPLLTSDDVRAAGIPRGPRWGTLLREAEELQLRAALATREQALAWLAGRAQEGGNASRNRNDTG